MGEGLPACKQEVVGCRIAWEAVGLLHGFKLGEAVILRAVDADNRDARQQQIDNALAGQNSELALRNSAQGWDMSPENPRNQGRPDRSRMAQVKRYLEDGGEATYDVPVEQFQPQQQPPPGPGQDKIQQALQWAKANPNDPRAKRIMQVLGSR